MQCALLADRMRAREHSRYYFIVLMIITVLLGIFLASISRYIAPGEVMKRFWARTWSAPTSHWLYKKGSRDQITVMTIVDSDLKYYKTTYPLPYKFHAERLRGIAGHSPKAIFIDILFIDEREDKGIENLVKEICTIRSYDIPIYIASLAYIGTPIRSELKALTTQIVRLKKDGREVPCITEVAVPRDVDNHDRVTWQYDMYSPPSSNSGAIGLPTAATRIYNDLHPAAPLPIDGPPLALVWGTDAPENNLNFITDGGKATCRIEWNPWEILPIPRPLVPSKSGIDISLPFCPFHLTLPMRALREMNSLDHKLGSLDSMIKGKIVIYGVNLQSLGDSVYSPVHDRLPGVQMHAMALDNLLTYGKSYPQASDFSLLQPTAPTTIFPLLAIFLLSGLVALRAYLAKLPRDTKQKINFVRRELASLKKWWHSLRHRFVNRYVRSSFLPRDSANAHPVNAYAVAARNLAGRSIFFVFDTLLVGLLLHKIAKFTAKFLLAIVLIFICSLVGLTLFHVGPLVWIEYAVMSLISELVDWPEKITEAISKKYSTFKRITNSQ